MEVLLDLIYIRALQTSYFKLGEKESEMNFSPYMSSLHIAKPGNTPGHRQLTHGGSTLLVIHPYGYQGHDNLTEQWLYWFNRCHKDLPAACTCSTQSSYITRFLGNWKCISTKLPDEGFLLLCYCTTRHSRDYLFIETIRCDSVIWCPDFLKTSSSELPLENASSRFDKTLALIKDYFSENLYITWPLALT